MRLLKSKAEELVQEDLYKHIERCGRTCYKSEDKITEDSAKGFVERMIASKHTAMLEHGTVYLTIPENAERYRKNPHTKIRMIGDEDNVVFYVTTNYRVLVENNWLDDLKYQCEPTEHHIKRRTFKLTCDRGVSHELVRHRVFSFAQESTRYCNYTKDKFGHFITFIVPTWLEDRIPEGEYEYQNGMWEIDGNPAFDADIHNDRNLFLWGLSNDEYYYFKFIKEFEWKPQQARQILSNALKTEVIMTGFEDDWERFFDLRYKQSTGAVHPDMLNLTTKLREVYDAIRDTRKVLEVSDDVGKEVSNIE